MKITFFENWVTLAQLGPGSPRLIYTGLPTHLRSSHGIQGWTNFGHPVKGAEQKSEVGNAKYPRAAVT